MILKDVYEWFKLYFPSFAEKATMWFPNGKNSIRIRMENGSEYAFTCNGKYEWKFETLKMFMKGMGKKK